MATSDARNADGASRPGARACGAEPLQAPGARTGEVGRTSEFLKVGPASAILEGLPVRALIDVMPNAMMLMDRRGIIRLANSRLEDLLHHRRGSLAGKPCTTVFPTGMPRAVGDFHRAQESNPCEIFALTADGQRVLLRVVFTTIGAPTDHWLCAVVQQDRLLEQQFPLLETSSDAVLILNLRGVVCLVNSRTEVMFDCRRGEVVGRPLELLFPTSCQDSSQFLRALADTRTCGTVCTVEMVGTRRNGSYFPAEVTLSRVQAADETFLTAVVRDATDRKQSEARVASPYEQRRRISHTLQRSLMGAPQFVPGLATASRYHAARQESEVGGDWFDFFPLGAGRIGFIVGHAMGRGIKAATVISQLRPAAHALAKSGMQPRRLMCSLDALISETPGQMATCLYLIIDPAAGKLIASSAGHLPVLACGSTDRPRFLPIPVDGPLGVGGIAHQQHVLAATAGSILALYTDGLVETPTSNLDDRLDNLASTTERAVQASSTLDEVADEILASLLPAYGDRTDDVMLLLAQIPDACGMDLPAAPGSVSQGRKFLRRVLDEWGCRQVSDTACLLASELMTNSVQHACGPLRLEAWRIRANLCIEVQDRSPLLPQVHNPSAKDESGRGLLLTDSLADDWGTYCTDSGKSVWFALRV